MSDKLNTHDRLSLALHAAVKRELLSDPERVLQIAKNNLKRWCEKYDTTPKWASDWYEILNSDVSAVANVLESEDEMSTLLRSSSPFTNVITEQERADIIEACKRQEADRTGIK